MLNKMQKYQNSTHIMNVKVFQNKYHEILVTDFYTEISTESFSSELVYKH